MGLCCSDPSPSPSAPPTSQPQQQQTVSYPALPNLGTNPAPQDLTLQIVPASLAGNPNSQTTDDLKTSTNGYAGSTPNQAAAEKLQLSMFRAFATKFGIPDKSAALLRGLGNSKVVVAADDSGSMASDAYTGDYIKDPWSPIPSRFEELQKMVEMVIQMAGVLSKEAMDLYFFHRVGRLGIRSFEEIADCFRGAPNGGTPTVDTLRSIVAANEKILTERRLIIFVATDGEPSNNRGEVDVEGLYACVKELMEKHPHLHITFLACVSDEKLLGIMDYLGDTYERVGVVDQFPVEYKEMMEKHQGEPGFTFTLGDYVTKSLLVSIDPTIKKVFKDTKDEEGREGQTN